MERQRMLDALTDAITHCAEAANQEKLPTSLLLEYSQATHNFAEAVSLLGGLDGSGGGATRKRPRPQVKRAGEEAPAVTSPDDGAA